MPKIIDLEQGSPEWLEWRRDHVGGSDAPAILFLTPPPRDRFRVWLEKVGAVKASSVGPSSYETPMQRGLRLEPEARNRYSAEIGAFAPPACLECTRWGQQFMSASVDGYIAGEKIVEIKCPVTSRTHLDAREGKIPPAYLCQMQHSMFVAEVPVCDYVSFDGEELVIIAVPFDEGYVSKKLLPTLAEFWNHVIDETPPVAQPDVEVNLEEKPEVHELLRRYLSYLAMREEADQLLSAAGAELKCALTQYGRATAPEAIVHWERRRGWIQYRELPEVKALLKTGVDLAEFRGPDVLSFRVERTR